MKDSKRRVALALSVVVIAGIILAIERPWEPPGSTVPPPPADLPAELADLPGAPDFGGATNWLNAEPLDLVDLRGKVLLVDFWTYSCINCIRTLPHLTGLYDTYRDHGLVVVGVHSPEFRFERDPANVQKAIERHEIHYPVPQDNGFEVWKAYNNRFWPTHYLVDHYGKVRDKHIGEGGYARTEEAVRELLVEAGWGPLPEPFEAGTTRGPRGDDITPELYAAGSRERIGNAEGYMRGQTVTYAEPQTVDKDWIYLVGPWYNGDEAVTAMGPASVLVKFRAGGSNFVAEYHDGATCVGVTLDGVAVPKDLRGASVREENGSTCIEVSGSWSYDHYSGPVATHTMRLEVPEGFTLYTFAFNAYAENDGGMT